MNKKPYFLTFTSLAANKIVLVFLMTVGLAACSSTEPSAKHDATTNNAANSTLVSQISDSDDKCQAHANSIATHAESIASTAQYLAAAKAMNSCVSTALASNTPKHTNTQVQPEEIMKMMAVATLNFIKAGDMHTASREVDRFKRIYPNQDLYFSDYTSFLDTATALLSSQTMAAEQISSLNISRALRDELERKHYWLSH